jgi:V/A-type H+-transporting ATPase subunit I
MLRLSLVVLERDERTVLRCLGRLGVVHLTRSLSGPETAPFAPRDRSQELARCDHLLASVEELRRSQEFAPLTAETAEGVQMSLEQAEERISLIEKRAGDLLQRRQHLMQGWGELTAVGEQVSSYRGWEIPLDEFGRYSFLHFVTGNLPAGNLDRLQSEIADNVALLPLPVREGRQPIIAMTTFRGRPALESALQRAGFEHEVLPAVEGATTDTLSEQSRREKEQVSADLEKVNAELRALATEVAQPLAAIERAASIERRLLEAEQHCPRTEVAVLLTGWVPAEDAPKLEQQVREITNGRCVIEAAVTEHSSERQIPILLRHPRLLRPFEMLVSAYGLPSYHELEPTLFVALSYVLMFGMMFGDAGHGAVLAIGGLFALFAGRTEKVRDAGVLILFAALSSIVFGVVYGSCFGLESFKQYALWHDPLEGDPMALMYGSLGIGIVIISLGLILNIINRFRRGDVIGGLLDKFGVIGALFYWGVLALVAKYAVIESRGLVNLAIVLFLVVPLVGWVLKEPIEYFLHRHARQATESSDGLFAAITESLVGAFEAVLSYLANTISFVRLAAYAMSHAALLVAAFMMAEEVRHFSVGGGFLSVLVIILGNLVAIVLEGIIASVQALRLEYYEFFGKFFSGNGRPFEPFRLTAVQT